MQKTKRSQRTKHNQSRRNQSRRNQSRRNQSRRNRQLNGGSSDFNVPIRSFYPQNTLAVDTQRMMVQTGGKQKNLSRKWLKRPIHLKGGSGFFGNFGTLTGSSVNANLITGTPYTNSSMEIPTQKTNMNDFKV